MEQEEADLSQLVSLQPLGMSESFETSSEMSLGEIPLNIVRAMELTMVDEFGQFCEHYWSASSSLSSYSLGSDHSLSLWSVDELTTCRAATCVDGFELSDEALEGEPDVLEAACTAAQPSQVPEELEGCSLSVQSVDALTACTEAQPSQAPEELEGCSLSVQSVDALTTACTEAQPSQAPKELEGGFFQKTLKKLFRQPLTPENSPQVVPVSANTSGADLDQKSDQEAEPERPLHVKMFRALKKSFNKTFCCLGDRNMVQE